jgi:hypothetical protein
MGRNFSKKRAWNWIKNVSGTRLHEEGWGGRGDSTYVHAYCTIWALSVFICFRNISEWCVHIRTLKKSYEERVFKCRRHCRTDQHEFLVYYFGEFLSGSHVTISSSIIPQYYLSFIHTFLQGRGFQLPVTDFIGSKLTATEFSRAWYS